MAITINELIAMKDKIKQQREKKMLIETSVGEIIFKVPDTSIVGEALDKTGALAANSFILYECAYEPNLKDSDLQKVYGCFDPIEIVEKIFQPGEINKIANKLLDLAGFKGKVVAKVYDEIKN